jgi:hypothetical protein
MFFWIYDYPSWAVATLFVVVFIAATWLAIYISRPRIHCWVHRGRGANEMLGLGLTSFSTLFGILLGLLTVASYQDYSASTDLVDREASSLAALHRNFSGYPTPVRGQLQGRLREYIRYTIEDGWGQQRLGIVPMGGGERITSLFQMLSTFEPLKRSEEVLHADVLRQFNQFLEIQRERLANVSVGLPDYFWWVVAVGSLLSILLIAMLDMEFQVHLVLGAVMATLLALMIFLIAKLDSPFRGKMGAGPDAIVLAYRAMLNQD